MNQENKKNLYVESMARLIGQPRYSTKDKSLFKATFGGNDILVMAVRNAMLGFDLTDEEKDLIKKSLITPEIHKLLKKLFLPELSKDIPITQNFDLWKTEDVNKATPETFEIVKEIKTILFQLIGIALRRLENPDNPAVDIGVDSESTFEFVTARNSFIDFVENRFAKDLVPMANSQDMTPEELMEKIKKDSSK